jgi:aminoglycoside phosphotransferase (APT) family kinase protein
VSGGPHGCDRALDADGALRAVASCFPELRPARAERFAEGWDSEVYLVDGEWLFRFPKRREVVPSLELEIRLLPLVAETLSVAVPRFELVGSPGPHFPYPFAGYRPLAGVPGDALPDALPAPRERRMARGLGRVLAELHAVPTDRARALGAVEASSEPSERLARAREVAPSLAAVLPPDLHDDYAALVARAAAPPASPLLRLTHGDLAAEHLLFDAATLGLGGIIDFGDVGLRDPAIDFVGLFHWRGERFVRAVLDGYALETDPGLLDRVRHETVVASGIWLAEAVASASIAGVRLQRRRFDRTIAPALRTLLRAR